jgi:hypothetical protein
MSLKTKRPLSPGLDSGLSLNPMLNSLWPLSAPYEQNIAYNHYLNNDHTNSLAPKTQKPETDARLWPTKSVGTFLPTIESTYHFHTFLHS